MLTSANHKLPPTPVSICQHLKTPSPSDADVIFDGSQMVLPNKNLMFHQMAYHNPPGKNPPAKLHCGGVRKDPPDNGSSGERTLTITLTG